MAEITLKQEDLVGGLPGLAHRLTGNPGNGFLLQRTNNIDQYSPLTVGQKIIVPDNLMKTAAPVLSPFANSIADSLPRNRLAVEGILPSMNPSEAITNKNVNELATNSANALFNPYFDKQQQQATRDIASRTASQIGGGRDAFNANNTLDSSFAKDTLAQAQATLDQQKSESLGTIADNRKLAVAQEVATQIAQEQAVRDFLLNISAKETLPATRLAATLQPASALFNSGTTF